MRNVSIFGQVNVNGLGDVFANDANVVQRTDGLAGIIKMPTKSFQISMQSARSGL